MSFDKAGRTDLIPASHRKTKVRSDKGIRRVPKKRKPRKDKGKSKAPPELAPFMTIPSKGGGPMSSAEHVAVEALLASVQGDEPEKELDMRGKALAKALGRSTRAIRNAIVEARERLQTRARAYADLHFEAATRAALEGDAGPSQWALERITAPGEKGELERIVEPESKGKQEQIQMPTIQLGFQLGGIAAGATLTPVNRPPALPAIDVDTVEDEGNDDISLEP